ncbi:hypothetical protein ABFX02_06G128200 [Erythranthe guttata]
MAPLNKSPSSSKPTIIRHFTDPKHPLHLVNIPSEFLCNGCSALGFGARYRCHACDVDLHEFCATCPSVAQSALHPKHPLTLVNLPVNDRFCDLCGDLVNGLFYACEACEFDVHPLCTQLPLHVRLTQHPQHLLKLQPGNPAACALCRQSCTAWRYRCDACSLDIHLECVLAGDDGDQTPSAAPPAPPSHMNRSSSMLPPPPPQQHQQYLNHSVSMPSPSHQYQQQPMGYGGCTVGFPMGGGGGGGYNMNGMPSPEMMMMMNNYHHQQQQQHQKMMMMNNHQQNAAAPLPEAAKPEGKSGRSRKRKIYSIVARVAISAVTTSLIGVPLTL